VHLAMKLAASRAKLRSLEIFPDCSPIASYMWRTGHRSFRMPSFWTRQVRSANRRSRGTTALTEQPNSYRIQPDERGHFGQFGGRYVAETLMPLILDLEHEYRAAKQDPAFRAQFDDLLEHYVGRPSPLYFAERLTEHLGGAQIWFKREELKIGRAH